MAPKISVIIGSGNSLLPGSTKPLPKSVITSGLFDYHEHVYFIEIWIKYTTFVRWENVFQNVMIWKMAAILYGPHIQQSLRVVQICFAHES